MRRILAVLGLTALATIGGAENGFNSVSVTATSQTVTLQRPRANVTLCNYGTYAAYFRLFNDNDTPAAATTSYAKLPAGTSSSPACLTFAKSVTESGLYAAVSIVCDTAQTATVHILSD